MSDETEDIIEEKQVEDVTPVQVVIKKDKKPYDVYDSQDDPENNDDDITPEQIKEFEDGKITRY